MYIDEQFVIRNLYVMPEYKGNQNVVVAIQWDVITDDLISFTVGHGYMTYLVAPEGANNNWIKYEDLTEQHVMDWINVHDSDTVARLRALTHKAISDNHFEPIEILF